MKTDREKLKDTVPKVTGEVEIAVRDVKTRKVVRRVVSKNVVVNNARTYEAHLLAGNGLGSRYVSQIGFGIDGTAETAGDTGLTDPGDGPVRVSVDTYDYPDSDSVRFTGTLRASEGNGNEFKEVGLLFQDNSLAARKTFDCMAKSSLFEWEIRWTLTW